MGEEAQEVTNQCLLPHRPPSPQILTARSGRRSARTARYAACTRALVAYARCGNNQRTTGGGNRLAITVQSKNARGSRPTSLDSTLDYRVFPASTLRSPPPVPSRGPSMHQHLFPDSATTPNQQRAYSHSNQQVRRQGHGLGSSGQQPPET